MTCVRKIKRQILCSVLQLVCHAWWSNKHFLSFLSHLWPTWPDILFPKQLLHPHKIQSSNGEDHLCDMVGEDSNLLHLRRKWTHPFCSTGGWFSHLRSSIREENHHPLPSFLFFGGAQPVGGYPYSTSQPVRRLVKVNPVQHGRHAKFSGLTRQRDLLH